MSGLNKQFKTHSKFSLSLLILAGSINLSHAMNEEDIVSRFLTNSGTPISGTPKKQGMIEYSELSPSSDFSLSPPFDSVVVSKSRRNQESTEERRMREARTLEANGEFIPKKQTGLEQELSSPEKKKKLIATFSYCRPNYPQQGRGQGRTVRQEGQYRRYDANSPLISSPLLTQETVYVPEFREQDLNGELLTGQYPSLDPSTNQLSPGFVMTTVNPKMRSQRHQSHEIIESSHVEQTLTTYNSSNRRLTFGGSAEEIENLQRENEALRELIQSFSSNDLDSSVTEELDVTTIELNLSFLKFYDEYIKENEEGKQEIVEALLEDDKFKVHYKGLTIYNAETFLRDKATGGYQQSESFFTQLLAAKKKAASIAKSKHEAGNQLAIKASEVLEKHSSVISNVSSTTSQLLSEIGGLLLRQGFIKGNSIQITPELLIQSMGSMVESFKQTSINYSQLISSNDTLTRLHENLTQNNSELITTLRRATEAHNEQIKEHTRQYAILSEKSDLQEKRIREQEEIIRRLEETNRLISQERDAKSTEVITLTSKVGKLTEENQDLHAELQRLTASKTATRNTVLPKKQSGWK